MRFDRHFSWCLICVPLACASVEPFPEDSDESASGGKTSSGGKTGSGGNGQIGGTGSGGKASGGASSGGTSSSSGGQDGGSGGSVTTGGASSGGQSSAGGTSSGGAFTGECAAKPSMATWRASTNQKSGDLVVHQCSKKQATCQNLDVGVDSLFECTDGHVNNCITQYPEDGSAWTFRGECEELMSTGGTSGTGGTNAAGGMGGDSGMAGAGA